MTAVLLVLLFVLIAINGIFVAAEFALVRSRRARVEQLASEGTRGASSVLEQLDRIDEYLSACQLGITMASIGIGFLGEPAVAELVEPIFGGLSHGVAVAISVAIAYGSRGRRAALAASPVPCAGSAGPRRPLLSLSPGWPTA
jgi:CBS domain containing-hemolysin-like protein